MPEHTPGPWRIETAAGHADNRIVGSESIHTNGQLRNSRGISSASYSDTVCEIQHDLKLSGPAANAQLIAAAPSLLAACEAAEKLLDGLFSFYGREAEVANWHLNGDLEPWDEFYDEKSTGDELSDLRAAIAEAKGETDALSTDS